MLNPIISPLLQALPLDARRRLEQQQQQTIEQMSSQMARSLPSLRLDFAWRQVILSSFGVESTCSYRAGKDYVLISQRNDPWRLRLERRSDGTLAWNGLVFRQMPGSASSGSLALFLWSGAGLLLAPSAGDLLWYLGRHGILGGVVLFFDEHFVVPGERKLELPPCKVVPLPPLTSHDDSRFMAPGVGRPQDNTRFMPPKMLSAPAPPDPPSLSPPKP